MNITDGLVFGLGLVALFSVAWGIVAAIDTHRIQKRMAVETARTLQFTASGILDIATSMTAVAGALNQSSTVRGDEGSGVAERQAWLLSPDASLDLVISSAEIVGSEGRVLDLLGLYWPEPRVNVTPRPTKVVVSLGQVSFNRPFPKDIWTRGVIDSWHQDTVLYSRAKRRGGSDSHKKKISYPVEWGTRRDANSEHRPIVRD